MFHTPAQGVLQVKMKHVLLIRPSQRRPPVSESPHLLVEREGHVVILTMNRPEARNAFGSEMLVRLADAWDLVDGDDTVRVAVLTGAGGHFCAGSDLKAMAGNRADDEWSARFKKEPDLHWKALLRAYRLKKPLVA